MTKLKRLMLISIILLAAVPLLCIGTIVANFVLNNGVIGIIFAVLALISYVASIILKVDYEKKSKDTQTEILKEFTADITSYR